MGADLKVNVIILKARCAAKATGFPAVNPVNVAYSNLSAQKEVNPCVAS